MTRTKLLTLLAALLMAPCFAGAEVVTFTPDPPDLDDLAHQWVYTWGIDLALEPGEHVSAAELTFHSIRNWDDNDNVLYIHLLDWAELGVEKIYNDNQGGGDYFATDHGGVSTHLVTYENLPPWPQDLTYHFDADELAALNSYLADERVALGLDPDCHFFNCGVEWVMTIVPEPASLVLLALGGLLMAGRK